MKRFLILDAARCGSERIDEAKTFCNQAPGVILPLASNELYLESVAPHLFESENALKEWYAENGWGDAWGIFFDSDASYDTCLLHFQQIVIRKDAGGSRYFRFYDPRVLKTFLPACDNQQLAKFFGPVEKFLTEGDTKSEAVEFTLKNQDLQKKIITTASLFGITEEKKDEPELSSPIRK